MFFGLIRPFLAMSNMAKRRMASIKQYNSFLKFCGENSKIFLQKFAGFFAKFSKNPLID